MKAIALDVGNADHGIKEATEELVKVLTSYKSPTSSKCMRETT
jgi:hypothetical protein